MEPPKKKPFKLIALVVALAHLVVSIAAALFVASQGPRCLTTADLQELLGRTDVDAISSSSDFFFNYQVEFTPSSTSYNTDAETTGVEIVKQISTFYENHPNKSIILTLTSEYFNDSDTSLAKQRIEIIRADLLTAGISSEHIIVKEPTTNDPENDAEMATTVNIAITSTATCK